MAYIIELESFSDQRGHLTTVEKHLPFDIKRAFFLHGASKEAARGEHRHLYTMQVAICVSGSCKIYIDDGKERTTFELNSPSEALLMEPNDWHRIYDFSPDAVVMVLADRPLDPDGYAKDPLRVDEA